MSQSSPQTAPTRRPGVYLGRFLGIRFYLDYSWFLIAAIVIYTLSSGLFKPNLPNSTWKIHYLLGIVTGLLFFLSILLHELGHSVVSKRCGIRVPRITLMLVGGIAETSREPDNPKSELKIAIAGPAVSLLLVFVFGALQWACNLNGILAGYLVFKWLSLVNLSLIIFNALPGYPLDGGRVLRALIWARTGNFRRATYITSRIGVGLSWMLIILGFASLAFLHGTWNAFVFFFIGIFLKNAAEAGYTQALYDEVLAGVRVRDVMTKTPVSIPSSLPANLVVDEIFFTNHHVAFPVCDGDDFRGLLRIEFLKEIPRDKWPYTSAGDIVAANDSAGLCLSADETAVNALRRLLQPGQGHLAVLDGGKLAGIITRADILQFIRIHTELEA